MDWGKSRNIVLRVIVVFLILFTVSTLIHGSVGLPLIPGPAVSLCNVKHHMYVDNIVGDYACNGLFGLGFPFAWDNIDLLWTGESYVPEYNDTSLKPMVACIGGCPTLYWKEIPFDPVNLLLDVLVWLAVASLLVMAYYKLKKKPAAKKPKR